MIWKKRAAIVATACIGLAMLVAGCSSDDDGGNGGDSGEPGAKPRIAFLQYTDAGYPQAMVDGAGDHAESVTQLVANFDPQKQDQQCRDAIQSGRYDAILLNAVDPTTGIPCVTAAQAADIPLVAVEIPIGEDVNTIEPQVEGVVGSAVLSYAHNGQAIADLTTEACDGKDPCNVIVALATPTDALTNAALDAVGESVPNVNVQQEIVTNYNPAEVSKTLPDALTAHPDVDVIVLTADNEAPAAVQALNRAGLADSVKVIANGGSQQGVDLIKSGDLFGTVGGWPRQMGAAAGKMAEQAFNGETVDPNAVDVQLIDEPRLVTPETVDQFEAEW